MTKFTLILTLLSIWGCINSNQRKEKTVTTAKEVEHLLEKEKVIDKLFITSVNAGEVFRFKIKGFETKNLFSDIYYKMVNSYWNIEECPSDFENTTSYCPELREGGLCELYYRDFMGETSHPIDFSKREDWPLQITVGTSNYPLDDEFAVEGDTLYATLTISQEMLTDGDDVRIEVIQEEVNKTQVGFQRFGTCEGKGERGFYVADFLHHYPMDSHGILEIEVSVKKEVK